MSLTADGQGAVFDVPIALAKDFVAGKGIDVGLFSFLHVSLRAVPRPWALLPLIALPFFFNGIPAVRVAPTVCFAMAEVSFPGTCSSEPS
jgi:hypothetical protein